MAAFHFSCLQVQGRASTYCHYLNFMNKEQIFGGNVTFQVYGMYSENDYFYSNCFFTPEKCANIYLWKFSNILGN